MRSCRTTRTPLAPIAARTAISCSRAVVRASSRLAILAQAISSTRPTAPSRISKGVRESPTSVSSAGITEARRKLVLRVRILLGQGRGDHIQVGARLLDADAGLEAAKRRQKMSATLLGDGLVPRWRFPVSGDGRPELDIRFVRRKGKPGRSHSHHGVRFTIERDGASHDAGIAAELTLPQGVAEHHHVGSRRFFRGQKPAPQLGLDAECREQVPGHHFAVELLGLPHPGQHHVRVARSHQVIEDVVLRPKVEEVRVRETIRDWSAGACPSIPPSSGGRGRHKAAASGITVFTTLNTAVLAPIPSASVSTATAAKPGFFAEFG